METTMVAQETPGRSLSLVEEPQKYVNGRVEEYLRLGDFMRHISLTPNRIQASENHGRCVFDTTRQAKMADRRTSVHMVLALASPLGMLFTVGPAWDMFGPVVGILAGIAYLVLGTMGVSRITAFMSAPSYSVTPEMVAGWSEARRILEAANEENTVPGVLADLQHFESEARVIYMGYDELIGEVAREQAARDFLTVCGIIEVLGQIAVMSRDELYSTRRQQYFN